MGIDTQLTLSEEISIAELEAVIQRNRWAFLQTGKALLEIRDRRLYRNTHSTFEDYCKERWELSRPAAYQYIDASTVVGNLSTQVDKASPSFTQARELASLEPEQQREVAAAVDFANTPVRKLKERIKQVKAGAQRVPDTPESPHGDILPSANEEPRPEPGMFMVRIDALCQLCRDRLFPKSVEASSAQTPVEVNVAEEDVLPNDLTYEPADDYERAGEDEAEPVSTQKRCIEAEF